MTNWFRQLVTGGDGVTHDLGRWSWLIFSITLIATTLHEAWVKGTIDPVGFGQGCAAIVGAHGLALWAKKDTEPK